MIDTMLLGRHGTSELRTSTSTHKSQSAKDAKSSAPSIPAHPPLSSSI